MAAFTTEVLPGRPVVLQTHFTSNEPHDADAAAELEKLLNVVTAPHFCVFDLTGINMTFPQLVQSLAFGSKGTAEKGPGSAILKHPNLREALVISTSPIIEMGTKALGQVQYGGLKVSHYKTLGEAIAYVDEKAAVPV